MRKIATHATIINRRMNVIKQSRKRWSLTVNWLLIYEIQLLIIITIITITTTTVSQYRFCVNHEYFTVKNECQ